MYRYDEFDHQFVRDRTNQFRNQAERRLSGELTEEEFRPLRLMNGLYLQLHAYMLRVAIPYGTLSSRQMRQLALIAEKWDRGYGHFTTRQNIQYNWIKLEDTADILDALAEVEMHAIQTSGNCIRNVTTDHWAGAAADEIADPRPVGELLRQWSSLHPEFSYLPRKFKIAVTGAPNDRAAVKVHDIGLRLHKNGEGEIGWEVIVGGGLGRTPMVGVTVRDFLPQHELIGYLEAIMRVYNLYGRRDNKYKARIKILVHEIGAETFKAEVEAEYAKRPHPSTEVEERELKRIAAYFAAPPLEKLPRWSPSFEEAKLANPAFARWTKNNLGPHQADGYAIVNISLKPEGGIPGDATADQMRVMADLAERYSFDELRVSHAQNIVLPHVKKDDVFAVYQALEKVELAAANYGLAGDIIACPGLDYCALATARSIPIAQSISRKFADSKKQDEIGKLKINISGCINACGHHHVGHIGILGLDKKGEEFYQITLGGSSAESASIGTILGPGFAGHEVADAIETILDTYLKLRDPGEEFLATYRRLGAKPFKEALYATA
ncbi:nitrite/sulfite reductase [Aestuariivirga sp.]|jgi:sulfite reductase (NADPH) hemoprotein beta-component|uniref:nitrite/sulfite reductase n=1 Tax=Aestuariivirga sp. TaxID=2650926 RepID=UPI003783A69A